MRPSYRRSNRALGAHAGFTLAEVLVGLMLFGIFSLAVASFMQQTFGRLGVETRTSVASNELRNAIDLMRSELQMGSSVSPYLPGTDPSLVRCTAQMTVTGTTLRFLVVHDEATGSGIRAYYVGYRYDAATGRLLRGQIAAPSTTACTLPGGDPTANNIAFVLAEHVTAVDTNGNGVNEPVFAYTSPTLTVNIGIQVQDHGENVVTQKVSTAIFNRAM